MKKPDTVCQNVYNRIEAKAHDPVADLEGDAPNFMAQIFKI